MGKVNIAHDEYHSFLRLLRVGPVFERVRSDPRFIEILKKVGMKN